MHTFSSSRRLATIASAGIAFVSVLLSAQVSSAANNPQLGAACANAERNRVATVNGARLQCLGGDSGLVWRRAPGKARREDIAALAGTWKTVAGSQAGYRMREFFIGGVAKSEAVGRTSSVEGVAVLEAQAQTLRIRSIGITVGTPGLKSEKPSRDEWLKTNGLETSVYESARFELSSPVPIAAPKDGETIKAELQGRLLLHGVTKPVVVAIEGRRTGDLLDVVGSARILLKEFNIETPVVPGMVSADDTGLLEFALILKR